MEGPGCDVLDFAGDLDDPVPGDHDSPVYYYEKSTLDRHLLSLDCAELFWGALLCLHVTPILYDHSQRADRCGPDRWRFGIWDLLADYSPSRQASPGDRSPVHLYCQLGRFPPAFDLSFLRG